MWITLSKNSQRRDQGNTLRLSVEKRGLSIRLNDQIAQAMSWSRGSRLGIKLGTEDHQGQIALCADPQGWTLQHAGTSSRKLRLMLAGTPVPGMPSRLPTTNAEYRIDIEAKEVIVTLPWHKESVTRVTESAEKDPIALRQFPQQDRSMTEVGRAVASSSTLPPFRAGINEVVAYLRREGDTVIKSTQDGQWHLNGHKNVDAKHLIDRANRIRKRKGEPEMLVA